MKILCSQQFKAAMALPETLDAPQERNRGAHFIDDKMKPESVQSIKERHGILNHLGDGLFGTAYVNAKGNALKYTFDSNEAALAIRLKNNPLPCTVNVFNVTQIQDDIWEIEAEKLRHLPPFEAQMVDTAYNVKFLNENQSLIGTHIIKSVMFKYNALIECLKKHDLSTTEAFAANIGLTQNGSYKLLDLGFASNIPMDETLKSINSKQKATIKHAMPMAYISCPTCETPLVVDVRQPVNTHMSEPYQQGINGECITKCKQCNKNILVRYKHESGYSADANAYPIGDRESKIKQDKGVLLVVSAPTTYVK